MKSISIWLVLLNSVSRRHILQFCTQKLTFDRLQDFPLKQAFSARTSIFRLKLFENAILSTFAKVMKKLIC